ncbi:hypothetical protein CIHG_02188 [Coccidioides immitis H538.4]|uniref:Uncharacterized protein n=2 Tax=Coccidioides immitis TaxID=5501 RepID=A0A0J8UBB8_COCIT|nr:hypothetical protein CIRG_00360 [Coccidioides immitis RMSCC 2394]KMU84403.1 hypothetical protein CIHG_02188 [Coccidioides immitis H538.4]
MTPRDHGTLLTCRSTEAGSTTTAGRGVAGVSPREQRGDESREEGEGNREPARTTSKHQSHPRTKLHAETRPHTHARQKHKDKGRPTSLWPCGQASRTAGSSYIDSSNHQRPPMNLPPTRSSA